MDFLDKRVVLNIFPSVDTSVCAASVRRFNVEAAGLDNTSVICVSMDLPFALSRFCAANDIENVVDGPLAGLLARAIIVLDEDRKIIYSQLVDEITHEPDYEAAIAALKK